MVNVIRPHDMTQALDLLSQRKLTVFAGGTDLMIRHRARAGTLPDFPHDVLLINELKELRMIKIEPYSLMLGAAVTFTEILAHPDIPDYVKAPLAEIASPAIRNSATIGGNIMNVSPAGDALPMLYALGAKVVLRSKLRGEWVEPIEYFILGPKRTILKQDELLMGVQIPLQNYSRFAYRKVGSRKANAIAKLSFYAVALFDQNNLIDCRIAFGAMGPKIIRSTDVEEFIFTYSSELWIDRAYDYYEPLLNPIDDLRSTKTYRKEVALNLLRDFIEKELLNEETRV